MKFTQVCVAILFALTIVCAPLARAACSNASINGTYGTLSTGLNGSLQPASSLNQVKVDGLGHLSGIATKSSNGSIVTYTFKGTYAIGTNCTGTAAFTNQNNQTEHDKIYLNSANLSGLYTGGFLIQTDSNHVQSSIAMSQGPISCALGLKHVYSFEATGMDLGTGQVAAAGRVTFNGSGGITGIETLSLDGTIHSSVALNGSYTVNSDCSGTASITPSGGFPTSHWHFLVVNDGQEMMAIQTDADTIVTATFQQ